MKFTGSPALCARGPGVLHLVARAPAGNMLMRVFSNGRWGNSWSDLGGNSLGAPAIASWDENRLDIVYQGGDRRIWHKFWDRKWTDWAPIELVTEAQPALYSPKPGSLGLITRGYHSDVIFLPYGDGKWRDAPMSMHGHNIHPFFNRPSAVAWDKDRLDCAYLGKDKIVYTNFYQG